MRMRTEAADESTVIECGVAAWDCLSVVPDKFAALRREPGPPYRSALPANTLKHADEQTVAGVAASLRAIASKSNVLPPDSDFAQWSVVGAPRFPGRAGFLAGYDRFQKEGAWGVSPHIVPHRSLHSLSGMLSLILEARGPNFGVGGGPHAGSEAFLAAAALLDEGRGPGIWLVLTGWQPEFIPDKTCDVAPVCRAIALALTPKSKTVHSPCLRILSPSTTPESWTRATAPRGWFTLERFFDALCGDPSGHACWRLPCGGGLEWQPESHASCSSPLTRQEVYA